MRQHVNPLSKIFQKIEKIPPLKEIFKDPKLPIHIDIGSAGGDFLFDLAIENNNWNYLGIEIREKLVNNAKLRINSENLRNLYFSFGNVHNIFNDSDFKFIIENLGSVSIYFPDPWFKKKHHKRRVVQSDFINLLSNFLPKGALLFIKTDVDNLFDYMDFTILNNSNFRKLDDKIFDYSNSFNPKKIKTNREKYVITNQIKILERIYIKI